jgi:hypothetical protein
MVLILNQSEKYSLLELHKISPENLALGMGGKLIQADINSK